MKRIKLAKKIKASISSGERPVFDAPPSGWTFGKIKARWETEQPPTRSPTAQRTAPSPTASSKSYETSESVGDVRHEDVAVRIVAGLTRS